MIPVLQARILLLPQLFLVALVSSAFVSPHHGDDNKLLQIIRGPARQETRCRPSLTSLTATSSTFKEEEGLVNVLLSKQKTKGEEEISESPVGLLQIPILPARQSLESFVVETSNNSDSNDACFSILTWNILLPNSNDNNWWNHKMYNPWVNIKHRQWEHRHALIKQRLLQSRADIICLQEVNGETFEQDFAFLMNDDANTAGYEVCLHKKYRFRCATFFKRDKFCLEQVAHKDRALVTRLKVIQQQQQHQQEDTNVATKNTCIHNDGYSSSSSSSKDTFASTRMIHIVNCHLSGGAAPEQRLRQVHEALDQIRKWNQKASQQALQQQQKQRLQAKSNNRRRPRPNNPHNNKKVAHEAAASASATTTLVLGDFNSDGNTAVRRLLVEGCVTPEWREPQYPNVLLTSKLKYNPLQQTCIVGGNHDDDDSETRKSSSTTCTFVDAAELAYGANVCDGDYGERDPTSPCRPPTYVVPNLSSLLLSSPASETSVASPSTANNNNDDLMTMRTQFGRQVAQGLADTLGLQYFTRIEMEEAFESVDVNKDNYIDEDEVQVLLESVYVATFKKQIGAEKDRFFQGCGLSKKQQREGDRGLTRDEFCQAIKALQQQHQHQCTQQRSAASIDDKDFGQRLSNGIMDSLGLVQENTDDNEWQELDLIQAAFDKVDLDGNGMIDESEIQSLLESAFTIMNGNRINAQKKMFFGGFFQQATTTTTLSSSSSRQNYGLTREQFIGKLSALQQELQGGSQGAELVQVKTTTDVQHMIARFSPLLQSSLDLVFSKFSQDGKCLTQDEVNEFLIRVNGELGRGGTFRHAAAILERKQELQEPLTLMRCDWYEVFARELAEGKWWQVVYDLETCGATIRSQQQQHGKHGQEHNSTHPHYQAWLDYIYFDTQRLICRGFQEGLTKSELLLVYKDGDALPNEWHPSDHLPVAAIFSWNNT